MADEMADEIAVQTGETIPGQEGTETTEVSGGGEPTETENSQTGGEPTGAEGLLDGKTPEQLQASYKSLQTEFNDRNVELKTAHDSLKALEQYGGVEGITKWAEWLSNNERFGEFLKAEKQGKILGTSGEEVTDETRKAMDVVEKIATEKAQQIVQEAMNTQVTPMAESYKQRLLDENFKAMDGKYGDNWHEFKSTMTELAGQMLSQEVQDNPTFEDIERLYFSAALKDGKMEEMQAKAYEKRLKGTKSKSTGKPGPASTAGEQPPATSIAQAFMRTVGKG